MANKRNKTADCPKRQFLSVVKDCKSMAMAAKKLRIPFSTFKRRAMLYGYYIPNAGGKDMPGEERKSIKSIMSNKVQIKTSNLKNKLWSLGIKKKICEICGLCKSWNKQPITLELHHKDGNKKNNSLQNLQILCPNCHSQTKNYRNRKGSRKEKSLRSKVKIRRTV